MKSFPLLRLWVVTRFYFTFSCRIILFLCLSCSSFSFSQTFQRTFGNSATDNDNGTNSGSHCAAFPTSDGGYALVGSFGVSSSDPDVMLIKMNSAASLYWVKTIENSQDENGFSGIQTSDGGYAIVGRLNDASNKMYFVKSNSDASLLWTKKYASPSSVAYGFSVIQTTDGGYLLGGVARTNATTRFNDMYMAKMTSDGTHEWATAYSGTNAGNDNGFEAISAVDEGFLIAGYLTNAAGNNDVFIVKTTKTGTLDWTDRINVGGNDIAYSVTKTYDNGYVIAGIGHGNADLLLMKLDSDGNWLWSNTYDPPSTNTSEARCVRETSDRGFIIAGNRTNTTDSDMLLMKTTSNGTLQWCRIFEGSSNTEEYGSSVAVCPDGGFIISGYRENPGSTNKVACVVKTDSDGMATSSSCPTTTSLTPAVTARTVTVTTESAITTSYNTITNGGSSSSPTITAKNPCNNSTTLPVEMLSFKAICENGMAVLEWITALEFNNDYFSIERSTDGKDFQPIGKVYGFGTSSLQRSYEFTDNDVPLPTATNALYYRLKQVDYNGQFEYFGPISVRCISDETVITPSVSEGIYFINRDLREADISVYSLVGEKVTFDSRATATSIDISSHPSGIYFIKIVTPEGCKIQKVIKM